jgi:hypothetical protein
MAIDIGQTSLLSGARLDYYDAMRQDEQDDPEQWRATARRFRYRRLRNTAIVLAVIALLVGGESLLQLLKGPEALVVFENQDDHLIENLVFDSGASHAVVGVVAPGAAAKVLLGGRGPSTLQLSYESKGSKTKGLQIQGFNPAELSGEGMMLVIRARNNGIEQFRTVGEPTTRLGRLRKWLGNEVDETLEEYYFFHWLRAQ